MYNANVGGAAASITVAALGGVSHVLDSLTARVISFGGTTAAAFTLQVTASGFVVLAWTMAITAAAYDKDDISFSGLDISTLPNTSLVVAFTTAPPVNVAQDITIQGHDV